VDLESLVNLCQTSKQLQYQCLDFSDQQLQLIVQKALHQKQPKMPLPLRGLSPARDSLCSSLAWLLGALSKRWGIMQLAARLDLQQALLAAEQDSLACYILISAGARITRELLRTSEGTMGLRAWAEAYKHLRLSYPFLVDQLRHVLTGMAVRYQQLQGVDDELLYDLLRVALMTRVGQPLTFTTLRNVMGERERLGWSVEMVFQLMVLAVKDHNEYALQHLFGLPVAEHITGQQYSQLLVLLFSHLKGSWSGSTANHIIHHVQWDDQLVERISAAVKSQVASSFTPCRDKCGICQLLQRVCRSCAATLPVQLQASLLYAATSSHEDAASTILRHLAKFEGMMGAAGGRAAVAAALQSWPVERTPKYRHNFKKLLRQPAVQQLPLEEVEQLLQQAAGSGCAEGLRCLLKALPAAQHMSAEGYQQLLELAVGSGTYRGRGRSCSKVEVLAVLMTCNLPARGPPGAGQLQQLLLKCIEQYQSGLVRCLLGAFMEAAQQLSPAAVYDMLLKAAQMAAGGCFSALLELVPQLEEVPLEVLQELLPALMNHSCPSVKLTPKTVLARSTYIQGSRSCSVCSLLKAAGEKLAAADVWEVLVAAASAPVQSIHFDGLAHLPGVDDMADDQVEQLLLAAIEVWKVPSLCEGWHGQQLLWRIEQLQGELLLGRRLPSAAVHRLILACVGVGCVGELRGELGLPTEGWEGPLSQQQLERLLQVALASSRESSRGMATVEAVLMLARLLPSIKERQQVVDMLWAAGEQLVGDPKIPDSQEHELTYGSESDLDADSQSDSGADHQPDLDEDVGFDLDADMELDSDAASDSDADSESDSGADPQPDSDADLGFGSEADLESDSDADFDSD
jgi:hypothetical protein